MAETVKKPSNRDMVGKMSGLEFAVATATLNMPDELRVAARRVLVDGEAQAAVRLAMGIPKQTLYYWITRITKAYAELMRAMTAAVPDGWSIALLTLPADQMERVKAQEAVAIATLRLEGVTHGQSK